MAPGPGGPGGGGGPHGGHKPYGGPRKPTDLAGLRGPSSESLGIFDFFSSERAIRKEEMKAKFGKKATLMGLKLSTTGLFREDLFKTRIQTADELLAEKRITPAEAKKRKMEAATKYYDYLRKIGYVTQEEYDEDMLEFAQAIGASYTPSGNRRTK